MKYKLTIEADTMEELQELMFPLQKVEVAVVETEAGETHIPVVKEEKLEKPKKETKKKAAKKSAKKVEEPKAEEPKDEPEQPTTTELTYQDDVFPVALEYSQEKGRDALEDLLGQFGVKSGKELTPDQFQPFIDEIKTQLAE